MFLHDYIIAGGGASGLLLAYRMSQDPYFDDKSILIIDKDQKDTNDRTWCYWEKDTGEWDHLLAKSWNKIFFGSASFSNIFSLGEYNYKMIRSADFYQYVKSEISKKKNFKFVNDHIMEVKDKGFITQITGNTRNYISKKIFTSIFDSSVVASQSSFPYLKQHFVGWFVKSEKALFDENTAVFMDFDIAQSGNTRFMYVLPSSPYEALVEYTLFSEDLLDYEVYESEIRKYLSEKYNTEDFTIIEKEQGNIPMTCFPFSNQNTTNLMHIGSAGGWTKASTGFTFANACKYSRALATFVKHNNDFRKFSTRNKSWYYDLIFLDVLYRNNALGSTIFTSIFAKNNVKKVLNFLDEKGSFIQDISIMQKTKPTLAFMTSAIRCLPLMLKF